VYRRCDDFVGEVVSRVGPDTPILIVSDHGFHSFRQSVNLNTWLIQEGFMTLRGEAPDGKAPADSVRRRHVLGENVDWTRTRAYAMGLGQVYLNLKGREGRGIVAPEESKSVQDDLAARLLTMTDPKTEARIIEQSTSATTSIPAPI